LFVGHSGQKVPIFAASVTLAPSGTTPNGHNTESAIVEMRARQMAARDIRAAAARQSTISAMLTALGTRGSPHEDPTLVDALVRPPALAAAGLAGPRTAGGSVDAHLPVRGVDGVDDANVLR
jgi:hypothetical protein